MLYTRGGGAWCSVALVASYRHRDQTNTESTVTQDDQESYPWQARYLRSRVIRIKAILQKRAPGREEVGKRRSVVILWIILLARTARHSQRRVASDATPLKYRFLHLAAEDFKLERTLCSDGRLIGREQGESIAEG